LQIFFALARSACRRHGEVLGEHEDQTTVDPAKPETTPSPGNLPVGHPEVGGPMLDEDAGFLEEAGVEEELRCARAR